MRGLHLSHGLSPFSAQNPVISFLVVLLYACLQLIVSMSTSVLSAQPFCPPQSNDRVNADQLLKPNTICTSSRLFTWNASLWENAEQCVFCWRARQAGLCVEFVYSWIEPVPEVKAVLSQSFRSPVSDPLSRIKPVCTSSSERWHFERLAAVATCFRAEVWCWFQPSPFCAWRNCRMHCLSSPPNQAYKD